MCTQSHSTLYNPMGSSLPGFSVPANSPSKNTEVGCHFLLQGIFLSQGSNPCLLCLLHWQGDCLPTKPKTGFASFLKNVEGYFLVATSIRDVSQCLLARTPDILQHAILHSKNCSKSPMTSTCAIRYSCG